MHLDPQDHLLRTIRHRFQHRFQPAKAPLEYGTRLGYMVPVWKKNKKNKTKEIRHKQVTGHYYL